MTFASSDNYMINIAKSWLFRNKWCIFAQKSLEWRIMEEKLSTIYLVSGQTALQYLMSVSKKYRQIATEAIFECLRLGYPLNDMEITGKARELLRKRNVIG